ncbi:MAG: S-methyl-5-thioribose-1-phosphate isomerase [Bacillota bacterium]
MDKPKEVQTLYWYNNRLYLLDQRLLPHTVKYRVCNNCAEVVEAISEMSVRGAPAIGISAAYGIAIAAIEGVRKGLNGDSLLSFLKACSDNLYKSRPTAVNLGWALDRLNNWLEDNREASPWEISNGLKKEADKIFCEDLENNHLIGTTGADYIPQKASVLTHCNAGALATGGYGTALGVIRAAYEQKKQLHVYIDETRPLLQGARLTAFEMAQEKIPATLITDNCAGYLMGEGKIDLVVVGADRIAANGDTANKIGTYSLAVLASYHQIPFYIAAPLSTIDLSISSGKDIIIEERDRIEVTHLGNQALASKDIKVFNPAFDVTPAALITAIITEKGAVHQPNRENLNRLFSDQSQ